MSQSRIKYDLLTRNCFHFIFQPFITKFISVASIKKKVDLRKVLFTWSYTHSHRTAIIKQTHKTGFQVTPAPITVTLLQRVDHNGSTCFNSPISHSSFVASKDDHWLDQHIHRLFLSHSTFLCAAGVFILSAIKKKLLWNFDVKTIVNEAFNSKQFLLYWKMHFNHSIQLFNGTNKNNWKKNCPTNAN